MVAGCDRGRLRSAACGRNGVNASHGLLAGCRKSLMSVQLSLLVQFTIINFSLILSESVGRIHL